MKLDAKAYLSSLVGKSLETIGGGQPNRVLRISGDDAVVATRKSPQGQPVPIADVQEALDTLTSAGEVTINPESVGYRSAFVGAVLASIPGTILDPPRVRLAGDLKSLIERALEMITEPRPGAKSSAHPFARLFEVDLEASVEAVVNDRESYLVTGSVGKGNWAETPWVSVFDRNVTESAQTDYYVVYLFKRDGSGVYLSLNQGTTAVRNQARSRYLDVLKDRAKYYVGLLQGTSGKGLSAGPLNLGEDNGDLTSGYEAGNVLAYFYPRNEIPSNERLANDLREILRIYSELVSAIDSVEADTEGTDSDSESDLKETERRWLRWHYRAEGRNRRAAKKAKKHHGYTCKVCEFNFGGAYGERGRDYIEAHHLVPFSTLDERPKALDPEKDFTVLCSNCHRMVHRTFPPISPDELRKLLE